MTQPLGGRPSAERTLLDMAVVAATRSTCARLHVGAVLARDGRVLSTGYNGAPAGRPHCAHRDDRPCRTAVHAETNAVAFAARHGVTVEGATLYLTHSPCLGCAGLLINSGVAEVVYLEPYRSDDGIRELTAAGVTVRRYSGS